LKEIGKVPLIQQTKSEGNGVPREYELEDLPGVLREIAELSSVDAAIKVAQARGGVRAYFPTPESLTAEHWLVQAVGMATAKLIAQRFSKELVEIPLGNVAGHRERVRMRVARGLSLGKPTSQIAREAGVTERTVRNYKAQLKALQDNRKR
jgi:DNA-binding NarL/FixJ family response regulator